MRFSPMGSSRWSRSRSLAVIAGTAFGAVLLPPASKAWAQEAATPALTTTVEPEATFLHVGKPAPAISVSAWVKGEPVAALERGRVYVVEFWATWCGPCVQSIPHISELQAAHPQATVIGVAVWEQDWSRVAPFVEEMGEEMNYRVAADEKGEMARTWMQAALQNGIPAAFVVNRDGLIAWIGHPMGLDAVLPKVIDGTWDLEAARTASKKSLALEARRAELDAKGAPINERIRTAWRAGRKAEAVAIVDELVALDPEYFAPMAVWKGNVLLNDLRDIPAAEAYMRAMVNGELKEHAETINGFAWSLVSYENAGGPDPNLQFALDLATRADALTGSNEPNVLDTLARARFRMNDFDGAIAAQERAISLAAGTRDKEQFRATLEEYRRAKSAR